MEADLQSLLKKNSKNVTSEIIVSETAVKNRNWTIASAYRPPVNCNIYKFIHDLSLISNENGTMPKWIMHSPNEQSNYLTRYSIQQCTLYKEKFVREVDFKTSISNAQQTEIGNCIGNSKINVSKREREA